MKLIDADAVTYEHITLPGDDEVVEVITRDDVAALPTVCCAKCVHFRRNGWTDAGHDIGICYAGDVVFPDEYSAQCRADYGCSNYEERP